MEDRVVVGDIGDSPPNHLLGKPVTEDDPAGASIGDNDRISRSRPSLEAGIFLC
jgi:hypothetical protein